MSIFEFAAGFENGRAQAERVLLLVRALGPWAEQPATSAVMGAGLTIVPVPEMLGSLSLSIAVDAERHDGILPGEIRRLPDLEDLYEAAIRRIGPNTDWLPLVRVYGMLEPRLHIRSGEKIQANQVGSAGCALRWDGGEGFATAGHVAPKVGASVSHANAQVGTVIWSDSPGASNNTSAIDFAVVECAPHAAFECPPYTYAHGRAYDLISLERPDSAATPTHRIMGMFDTMGLLSSGGILRNVHLSAGQMSRPGDSGTAVITSSQCVIGHVLGAIPGMGTLIQDLAYQLGAASPALPNLRL